MDRPGKKMAEYALKRALAQEMMYEAPDEEARKAITERVTKAGREAENEVKREMRGVKKAKGGKVTGGVTRADGCITKGHTKGRMV